MKPALPRILSAVPRTLHVQLEIAKAIRTLTSQEVPVQPPVETGTAGEEQHLIKQFVRELLRDLRKAGFNPDEPRVPAGSPDGGQWTSESGNGAVISDATPEWKPGGQYAANNPPGIGHNQGPPLEEPPKIPPKPPATPQALNNFIKAAAYWLAAVGKAAAARFLGALQRVYWLTQGLQYIYAYLYPPKTLAQLQKDALNPQPGYNIHHIVEQKPARDEGFPDDMIDGPDNLVRIPTLRHWQINAWFQRGNDEFDGLSPREYLRGKSWDERRRVGIDALIRFGVLKP
jgi:hypothetical protein